MNVNYICFNNYYYEYINNEYIEIEIFNFNKDIDINKYNMILFNKYLKKYFLFKVNIYEINVSNIVNNTDFKLYILFEINQLININHINYKFNYHYFLIYDIFSTLYINKYHSFKDEKINNIIFYTGSLKSYKNFLNFKENFNKFLNTKFENLKTIYCINNDITYTILENIDYDISLLNENINENNCIYICFLIFNIIKKILNIDFNNIIIINLNYSIIGLNNLFKLNFNEKINYYVDNYKNFCILNQKDFYKISLNYINNFYDDKFNILNDVKLSKIKNTSLIKLN